MQKKKIAIIFLVCGLILAFYLIFTSKVKLRPNLSKDIKIINSDIGELKRILDLTYYKGKESDIFSSTSLGTSEPDLYYTYWILKIAKDSDYIFSSYELEKLKNKIYPKLKFNKHINQLNNIYYIAWIEKYLNLTPRYNILNVLQDHYSKKDKLFYFENEEEDIQTKLIATSIAVDIIVDLDLEFSDMNKVVSTLINLYKKNDFFDYKSPVESLLNNGGLIMYSLSKLEVANTLSNDDFNLRLSWITQWNDILLNNSDYNDWVNISYINQFLIINKYFNRTNSPDFSNFIKQISREEKKTVYSFGLNDKYIIEPQYLYEILHLSKSTGQKLFDKEEVHSFIKNSLDTDLLKWVSPTINIQDIYSGLKIAREIDFPVDYNKLKVALVKEYKKIIQIDSEELSIEQLRSIFYFYSSVRMIDDWLIKEDELNFIKNHLLKNLTKIITKQDITKRISEIRLSLEIIALIDGSLPRDLVKEIETKLIKKIDLSNTNIKQTSDYYKIIEILNLKGKYPTVRSEIVKQVLSLKSSLGFVYKIAPNNEIDIISTELALEVLKKENIDLINSTEIINLIDLLKNKETLYRISPNSSNNFTNLTSILSVLNTYSLTVD